jgi:hypothetical protein
MTDCCTILRRTALLVVVAVLMPQVAQANPMLSGYGGPGEGSQAILGSTLINPPARGGGAGGASSSEAAGGPATGAPARARTARGAPAGRSRAHHGVDQKAAQRFSRHGTLPAGEIRASSETLGLSGIDLVYAIAVLAALVLAAALTRRLARSRQREGTER